VTADLERAKVAVGVTFIVDGFAFTGWLARAPAVRDDLHLTAAGFGLLLLCLSAAAVASVPLVGPLVQRIGPARAVLLGSLTLATGLVGLAIGAATGSVPVAGAALVLVGCGNSIWDVAQNVEGADVERRLGRTVMPRFHAGFSLGTVGGAGVGAAASALNVSLAAQLLGTAALAAGTMVVTVRRFLPYTGRASAERRSVRALTAWRNPRTLLIGLILLGFGFTEGAANDWLAIVLVDAYAVSQTVGAVGFGTFVTAMTLARMYGGPAIERWGRVAVLRVTAACAALGLLLVVTRLSVPVALAGAALWGVGASLGFPIGMSSAADDPVRAAVNVSVAGALGYGAFLAGPPLIGFLAHHVGVLNAMLCVFAALAVGVFASGAARPLPATAPGPRGSRR
jgi:MFS family permease